MITLKYQILKRRYNDITILITLLQQDILQIKHFQYKLFQNIIPNDDTIPQIKIFPTFYSIQLSTTLGTTRSKCIC